jgi:hypothetical protein
MATKDLPHTLGLPAVPPRPVGGQTISSVWGQAVHDSQFGLATMPDVRDGWRQVDLPANLAQSDLARADGGTSPLAGLNGSVVGFYWRKAGTITAGTINLSAQVGSNISPPAVLDSASGSTGVTMLATPITFVAGTAIRMSVNTVGLAPLTVDITAAGLIVMYDYVAG